jgi:hypothetical protein
MANGKWQISNGLEDRLPFASSHFPFAIVLLLFGLSAALPFTPSAAFPQLRPA